MSETTDFWAGEFGDAYVSRNRFDWRKRIPFWDRMVAKYGFRSAYEIGCNVGYNLSAIKHSIYGYNVQVSGEDVNEKAVWIARTAGLDVLWIKRNFVSASTELVFTSGVLIHVAPQDLKEFMQRIIDASCDYVLAIEYEAITEREIEYRGHKGKLWKRPYGQLYEQMGLTLIETGKVGKEDGFDDCTYWMLRK